MKRLLLALALLGCCAIAHADPRTVTYRRLYYADSLAAGDSLTTDKVPIFGSAMVVFYYGHGDTSAAVRGFYSDSAFAGGVQFSNDGTNWGAPLSNATATSAAETFVCVGGGLVNNTSLAPANLVGHNVGGSRMMVVVGAAASINAASNLIPIRWARFKLTNNTRGRASACVNCADMYRPFVHATVYYPWGLAGPIPTFSSP